MAFKPAAGPMERRIPRPARVQIRTAGSNVAQFLGYASTTGEPYQVRDWLGEYTETMMPGSFRKTTAEAKAIPLLLNHNQDLVLASTGSGTSRLAEDTTGLRNEADLDRRSSQVNDLCVSLERGDINAMSFSFVAVRERWNADYSDRQVSECRLFDTSIVTNPANPGTSAALRSAMRSALGREGRSLWLAEHEPSVRLALPALAGHRQLPADSEDALEHALRALLAADEVVCQRHGSSGTRTQVLAGSLLQARAGKVLSAQNESLIRKAVSALADARTHHQAAHDSLSMVLDGAGGDGIAHGTPPGNGSPIFPPDGAGPRSASLKLQRQREAELRRLGITPRRRFSAAALRAQRELELKRLRERP